MDKKTIAVEFTYRVEEILQDLVLCLQEECSLPSNFEGRFSFKFSTIKGYVTEFDSVKIKNLNFNDLFKRLGVKNVPN